MDVLRYALINTIKYLQQSIDGPNRRPSPQEIVVGRRYNISIIQRRIRWNKYMLMDDPNRHPSQREIVVM